MEAPDQSDAGYPEEQVPGADPSDSSPSSESTVREKASPGEGDKSGAPDNDDGKATGNPNN